MGQDPLEGIEMISRKQSAVMGRAVELESLAGYQKGSIVSSQIMNTDGGTVTIFAFTKAESLSEHTAPFDALIYILDGEASIYISGKKHLVKKGQMIILPANKPHSLKAVKRFKMLLVMIRS